MCRRKAEKLDFLCSMLSNAGCWLLLLLLLSRFYMQNFVLAFLKSTFVFLLMLSAMSATFRLAPSQHQ